VATGIATRPGWISGLTTETKMNFSALRTVPGRSWWTLAVTILIVGAFVFDRDLGVTMVISGLFVQLAASGLRGLMSQRNVASRHAAPASSDGNPSVAEDANRRAWCEWSPNDSDCDSIRPAPNTTASPSALFDDWPQANPWNDWERNIINPATGCSVDSYAGMDSGGCFYGESHVDRSEDNK
jgi:hypothetical protein